ncbi:hypothetical protein GCM10027168_39680 [Streptomyces capparidis]
MAPGNRKELATKPPLVILRVPDNALAHERGVQRVVEALRQSLDHNGRLAPYAHVPAAPDSVLLSERVCLGLRAPQHMTPDRYPNFWVMRDLVARIREHPGRWPGLRAEELRQHACDREQAEQRGWLGRFSSSGPPADTFRGWVIRICWLSITRTLPRWVWSKRTSRKVMRWLGGLPAAAGGRDLFTVMDQVAAVHAVRLAADPGHEEALGELEELLTRALLEDLSTPRVGGVLPKRRRRTARPVLLVELPPPGAPGARAAERFLRALHRMRDGARRPGPLVVAVGQPSPALLADLGDPPVSDFAQAAIRLGQDGPPQLVAFQEEAFGRPGLPLRPVRPRRFRTSWRTTTSAAAAVMALVLAGTGLGVARAWPDTDRSCVGGSDSVAEGALSQHVDVPVEDWYNAAEEAIRKENARAEAFAAKGRTVRTVVAFVSSRPRGADEALFDGTIPELRGIALMQKHLNDKARHSNGIVPLRVEVRPTGENFENAEEEAEALVREVLGGSAAGHEDHEDVVGVLGYAQSREETKAALQVLGRAEIPTVGTTATADEMLTGEARASYWAFTPLNSTEAGIVARFAREANIVAQPGSGDTCSPAEHAVVIETSADLYSRSIAGLFRGKFSVRPGDTRVFDFNQANHFPEAHSEPDATKVSVADTLATHVCEALQETPNPVVYWSARSRDFTAFIDAMDEKNCFDHHVTVLGGNELTNVAMTGKFADKDWLRLYYAAHRMPTSDERASRTTRQFVADYVDFVEATTSGTDPWRQDGHSAVAYDALHVLSEAVNVARGNDGAVGRRFVLAALRRPMSFEGATGRISYRENTNVPPEDKTLVLLRQLGQEPKVVLACGAYDPKAAEPTEAGGCPG